MTAPPLSRWLVAFGLTLAIELPLYVLLLRRALGVGGALGVGAGVNLVTHPALWYLMPRFSPYWLWVCVSEALVVAVEAALVAVALRRARAERPLRLAVLAALLANGVSTAVGLLVLRA